MHRAERTFHGRTEKRVGAVPRKGEAQAAAATAPDNHKHHQPQRSEQGLKIEKKRRLAEEQEERDNELRKIGMFFDREAGMYMRD